MTTTKMDTQEIFNRTQNLIEWLETAIEIEKKAVNEWKEEHRKILHELEDKYFQLSDLVQNLENFIYNNQL